MHIHFETFRTTSFTEILTSERYKCWNTIGMVLKSVNLVDLVKNFQMSVYYLLTKFGFDTAENEPLKVHLIFKSWDFIFTEPPRPES